MLESSKSTCPICGYPNYTGEHDYTKHEPSYGQKIYVHGERDSDREALLRARDLKYVATQIAMDGEAEAFSQQIEFSAEMNMFISSAEQWHEERFRELGIDKDIPWAKVYKVPEDRLEDYGVCELGIIRISELETMKLEPKPLEEQGDNFSPLEIPPELLQGRDPEEAARSVRSYIEASTILHELYHDSAPMRYVGYPEPVDDDAGGPKKKIYSRRGLNYSRPPEENRRGKYLPALEEGMAILVQKEATEQLARAAFPEGAQLYDRLLDYIISTDSRLNGETMWDFVMITNFNGKTMNYGPVPYSRGYYLAKYLASEVPDFFRLVEDARINNKSVSLARAIEQRFGRGAFKMVVSADQADGMKVARALANYSPQKSEV